MLTYFLELMVGFLFYYLFYFGLVLCIFLVLLYAGLKSWGTWCEVWSLCSSERSSRFWAPSQLWAIMLGVEFILRLWLSLSYPLCCAFPLSFAQCEGVTMSVFRLFCRGNVSICSCSFVVSIGGDELSIIYIAILNQNLLCSQF